MHVFNAVRTYTTKWANKLENNSFAFRCPMQAVHIIAYPTVKWQKYIY